MAAILVVDDDADTCRNMADIFGDVGYAVDTNEGGTIHVTLLVNTAAKFDLLRRWNDLFDDGVAAIFGIAGGVAELLALSFHGGTFTPARAAMWLAERGFKPLLFSPNSSKLAGADFDAPPAGLTACAVSANNTEGEC